MIKALEDEIKKPIQYELKVFVGSTDRLILRNFIEGTQAPVDNIEATIDSVLSKYLQYLKEHMTLPNYVKILPGVREILNLLKHEENMFSGLLTGNIKEGAFSKLSLANLWDYFPIGAFGDDAVDRNELPPIAMERAADFFRIEFDNENTWIIGDSPKDIICAKTNNLRSLAVATGWHSQDELYQLEPDIVLSDLSETVEVLKIFKGSFTDQKP
jgi:phosphoglycolate phosphatase-like HAD superfamily hydrolase